MPNIQSQTNPIPIESLSEYNVSEIYNDGTEIFEKPLNPSENFQRIVNQLDFNEVANEPDKSSEPSRETLDPDSARESKSSIRPFEKAKENVRSALNEVSALLDILTVVRDKRYMVLEPVVGDTSEQRNAYTLAGKKTALNNASDILFKGSERLRRRHSELADARSQRGSYHLDLIELRRKYRLKIFGHSIVGDLSLRRIGSGYHESGNFEVRELDLSAKVEEQGREILKSTSVVLQGHQEGEDVIRVSISCEAIGTIWEKIFNGYQLNCIPAGTKRSQMARLKSAQNLLVFREIHSRLCNEATFLSSDYGISSSTGLLVCTIFPGVRVNIQLLHYRESKSSLDVSSSNDDPPLHQPPSSLEVLLQSLLRSLHRLNQEREPPHPITGPVQVKEERRLAGPLATRREKVMPDAGTQPNMLRTFLEACKHYWMRKKVSDTLSALVKSTRDPQMIVHWNVLNTPTESTVKVDMIISGYENTRHRMALVIKTESVAVYLRDSRVLHFGCDMRELTNFFQYQLKHQQVYMMQTLLNKTTFWEVLAANVHIGYGPREDYGGSPAALLLASPDHTKLVCIRGGPTSGVKMAVLRLSDSDSCLVPTLTQILEVSKESPDDLIGQMFEEIDLDRVMGSSTVAKMEAVLACLTTV